VAALLASHGLFNAVGFHCHATCGSRVWESPMKARAATRLILAATLLLLGEAWPCAAHANTPNTAGAREAALVEASRVHGEAVRLYRARKFDEAITTARRALALQEKVVGPDHLELAATLDTLADPCRQRRSRAG